MNENICNDTRNHRNNIISDSDQWYDDDHILMGVNVIWQVIMN